MASSKLHGTVTESEVGRIDLMVRTMVDLSRSKLTALFEHGCVQLNKRICENPAERVAIGDRITVTYDAHQGYSSKKKPWSDRTFTIIYEDDLLLIVNKSAGVLTVPTNKEESNTLLERVTTYLSHKKKNHEAYLIHRLDRGMSGLMVFGKSPKVAKNLREQFDGESAKRVLMAIVNGVMENETGTIESHLDTHNNLSRYSTNDKGKGQHSITTYRVTKQMEDATAVEIELVTARRHQARAHLSELGHHVLGDERYRQKRYEHERWNKKRMALHAVRMTFIHPETKKEVSFKTELPISMRKFIRGGKNTQAETTPTEMTPATPPIDPTIDPTSESKNE
jgi:23S rRNA pseudouridine1911/1915/1917 synthase